MHAHSFSFIPNEPDDLHCFQAAYSMVREGLTGQPVSLAEAEKETGFREGMQSWPFAGMLSFAAQGLVVRNIEDFDPHAFVDDPVKEISRGAEGDSDVADFIVAESDLEFEVALVRKCLACTNIAFEIRRPTFEDVITAVAQPGSMAICNVNYRQLVGEEGYYGHFVVVDAASAESLTIDNPGPPAMPRATIATRDFLNAWHSPSEGAANLLLVSRP